MLSAVLPAMVSCESMDQWGYAYTAAVSAVLATVARQPGSLRAYTAMARILITGVPGPTAGDGSSPFERTRFTFKKFSSPESNHLATTLHGAGLLDVIVAAVATVR